jgi:NAD(P)-dependent dehydrogenase (short-subunit alcohol dehydrogenase family)
MDELDGKVAVVTGAASGIGRGLAQRFAAEGMRLALADIEAGPLEAVATELRAGGVEVIAMVTDVSDGDQVDALGDAVIDAFGAVHVVCNNAGVGGGGLMQDLTTADWQWVLGVNLWGVIHGMRVFLPKLLAQGEGHIVNTASLAGLVATPFMGPYNASKFAVVAISETTFQELRLTGSDVGVSVLCPGWVRTRIAESGRNRPDELANPTTGEDAAGGTGAFVSLLEGLIAGGLPPEEVADQVVDAIRCRRLWILTHPESIPAVQARVDAIVDGGDPPFPGPV